jgi:S1-C subfamily serine protease
LKVGDILVSIDGQPADNLPTVIYNFRLRESTEQVKLVVQRGGAQYALGVDTVEERSEFDSVSATADPQQNLVPELGILGVEINPAIAAAATGLRDPLGVIVVARAAGAAIEVPLQPKDVIRSVNRTPISSLDGLRIAVRPQAGHAGDATGSAQRAADVRDLHARLTGGSCDLVSVPTETRVAGLGVIEDKITGAFRRCP